MRGGWICREFRLLLIGWVEFGRCREGNVPSSTHRVVPFFKRSFCVVEFLLDLEFVTAWRFPSQVTDRERETVFASICELVDYSSRNICILSLQQSKMVNRSWRDIENIRKNSTCRRHYSLERGWNWHWEVSKENGKVCKKFLKERASIHKSFIVHSNSCCC